MRFISVIAQSSHITACRHGKKRRALGRDMQMVQLSLTSSAASSLAEGATSIRTSEGFGVGVGMARSGFVSLFSEAYTCASALDAQVGGAAVMGAPLLRVQASAALRTQPIPQPGGKI